MFKLLKRLFVLMSIVGILFFIMFGIFIGVLVQTIANNN